MSTPALDQCGQVYLTWASLGWVRWQGDATPRRQMMVEYKRCQSIGHVALRPDGFTGALCKEHEKR